MLDQIKNSGYPKEYNYFHLMVVAGLLLFSGYIGLKEKTYLQKLDYVFVGMGLALLKMIKIRESDSIILDNKLNYRGLIKKFHILILAPYFIIYPFIKHETKKKFYLYYEMIISGIIVLLYHSYLVYIKSN
tara:strand:+ start:50 stop:442 length:393 start_codon:yes stop_codon:yes gene_type:complete